MTRDIAPCVALALALAVGASRALAQPVPVDTQTSGAQASAGEWPHSFTANGGSVTVYQPQAISWPGQTTLTARAAIAVTPQGQSQPILGTVELTLATTTDPATGVVHLANPALVSSHFPTLDTQQATALDAKIRAALPAMQFRDVPLAAVQLSLKQSPAPSVAVDNTPPPIFYANRPASLLTFDGDPVLAPIGNTGLSFAVNTNWDVFVDQGSWFLLNNGLWFSAPAATGPWAPVAHLPPAFNALPRDANFADARKHIPAQTAKPGATVPQIVVSTRPAEIIVTSGPPQFVPIAGTRLQRVDNTPNALFFDPALGRFYVLFSGRWFAAAGLDGPWSYATDQLPPDFALIPPNGPEAAVLAAVPGTVAAQEAVLRAQIPTTATLQRKTAKLVVVYAGPPRFEPIPGTTILRAVNTGVVVLKIGDAYYACDSGVWFVSAAPTGPWALADSIPAVIKTVPPSSPVYNVTYVQVYGSTPTTVTYGYTAGYALGFVSAGVLVYGTGYYYPPVVVPGPVPIYYPTPYTYAGGVYYNTANGAWARGGTIYGPYGAASGARYYNPATGAWAQGGAVYGPYGGAGAFSAYNPSTGSYARGSAVWGNGSGSANANFYNAHTGISGATNQNWNAYGRWGSSTFTGPNQTVNTQSRSNAQGSAGAFRSTSGAAGAGYNNRVTGNRGGAVRGPGGDVYAGRDGNVYQHSSSGWSKWNSGSWTPVQPPSNGGARGGSTESSSYAQLEQDRLGRQAGSGRFAGAGSGGGARPSGGAGAAGGRRLRR
jgi:hypothetical protein